MVAAHLAVERADQEPVQLQQADQEVAHVSSPSPAWSTEAPLQTTVELGAEFRVRRGGRRREGADDHLAAGREDGEALTAQMAEPALDTMADDGVADDATHDEPDPSGIGPVVTHDVDDQEVAAAAAARADHPPDVTTVGEPMRRGSTDADHEPGSSRAGSDRQALAALAATRGQDAAPGTGAHAQPEAVHLVAAAVVRLVRTLAHELSPMVVRGGHAGGGQIARWRRTALVEARSGSGFGRHRPPTRRWSGPGTSPGGAWTCGTRRHRVTEERYARRLRGVKSRPAASDRRPAGCGYPPSDDPAGHGFRRAPTACG